MFTLSPALPLTVLFSSEYEDLPQYEAVTQFVSIAMEFTGYGGEIFFAKVHSWRWCPSAPGAILIYLQPCDCGPGAWGVCLTCVSVVSSSTACVNVVSPSTACVLAADVDGPE